MPDVQLANGKHFAAAPDVSILDAARLAGLTLDHSCSTGRCGVCKAKLLSGVTRALGREESLAETDRLAGSILTCQRAVETDIELDIADLGLPPGIVRKILPCRIDSIIPAAPDVLRVQLRLPPNAAFAYLPGQYVNVIGPGGLRRSYSVANAPAADGRLELHIRQVPGGAMSRYWFDSAKPNDLLRLDGPIGTFFHRGDACDTILLATGTGYAPAKAMLEGLSANGWTHPVSLYWGGRTVEDHYHSPTQAGLHFDYHPVLSRAKASGAAIGHVQNVLLAQRQEFSNAVVYACGSEQMIASAKTSLLAAGLPPTAFHSDAFVNSSPESDTP